MFLITQDKKKIKIEKELAKQVGLLADMSEFFEDGSDPVPLNDVASKELKKCLAFKKVCYMICVAFYAPQLTIFSYLRKTEVYNNC